MTQNPLSHFDQFLIKVDGNDLSANIQGQLVVAVVEDDLAQPAMFMLCFSDPTFSLIDGTQFKLGSEVTLSGCKLNGQYSPLLTGEVTALEPTLEQNEAMLVVRGYDQSHRLYRGHNTRTFLNQTDSDIAGKVAREAGFTVDAESTSEQHTYVMQNNQSDMEFLRARAARIGYRVQVEGRKLTFCDAENAPPKAPAQEWSKTLLSFRMRQTAVAQSNAVQVRSWDPKTKQAIVGMASKAAQPSQVGDGKSGGDVAQQSFGSSATVTICDQPVQTQAEANNLAQSVLDEMSGKYLSAEGRCWGEPALKAGCQVEVKGVGQRLSGTYFVTATRHEYTSHDGYRTVFTVSGRQPWNLAAILDAPGARRGVGGVVSGIVTNINDPDNLGRVKVKFPWLSDNEESDWARIATPGGGKERGLIVLPEVDDEVLVAFEHGDINRPYVVGGLWNGVDTPPATVVENGKVLTRSITTRVGHALTLQDDSSTGQGFIQLKTKNGLTIAISDNDKQIQIKSQKHTITLDDQGTAVTIESGGDLELKGNSGTLRITAQGVELSGSGGSLKITSQGIEVAGNSGMLNIAAQGVELTSSINMKLEASAMVEAKAGAIMNIQGTLVKIN